MSGKSSIGKKFIIHGGILAMAGIIVRVIGMVYRIPLLNIIGSEGNGIYSVAYNIYNIALIISCYGLPMAVSKLVSARLVEKQFNNAYKVFRTALILALCAGGTVALVILFGADFLENVVYAGSYPGVAKPLRVLAPTILIVAALGVFRGFFQGHGTMIPTAISQLAEQIVNAVVSVLAGYLLINAFKDSADTAAYGAAGGTLGTEMGALTALLFMIFVYFIYKPVFLRKRRSDTWGETETASDIRKIIAMTAIPIMIGQTFYQISAALDDIMYANIMKAAGVTSEIISRTNGNYNSSYMILINLPMGVASAMSSSMLPSVVASYAQGKIKDIRSKISATVKINMMIAIPSFIGLALLGGPIIQLLFPSYDSVEGAMMLRIGAIAVVFYTMSTVTTSALQGIDKMNLPVKHSFISLIIHIGVLWLLLKFTNLGIYALVIGSATFPLLIFVLNLWELYCNIGYRQEIISTYVVPLSCAVVMGIVTLIVYRLIFMASHSNFVSIIPSLIIAVAVYFGLLYMCKRKRLY
ncbi:MAG: oligosaccharide flippase family protein [Bacteroides sp.]